MISADVWCGERAISSSCMLFLYVKTHTGPTSPTSCKKYEVTDECRWRISQRGRSLRPPAARCGASLRLHRGYVWSDSTGMSAGFLTWVQTAVLSSSSAAVAHRDRAAPPRSVAAGRRGALRSGLQWHATCLRPARITHRLGPCQKTPTLQLHAAHKLQTAPHTLCFITHIAFNIGASV